MNASPLMPEETPEEREWTILFLVDSNSGRASITTGYRAEVWLSEEMWEAALEETRDPIGRGKNGKAVVSFLELATKLFSRSWEFAHKKMLFDKD